MEVLGPVFAGLGSNSWVVGGSRTASGLPLLANDPHLGIQMPSIWYQTTLWCEELTDECPFRVSGFTFPGAPGVVVGHNQRIAWGVTNEAPDTMDLFLEEIEEDRYRVDDGWEPLEVRTEIIQVAGGEDRELEVRTTRHGPIISGRYGPVDDNVAEDGYEVALAWRALEPATLFEALLGINQASNWDEFRRAASLFDIAPQNLVYADVDGHIGYQATGDIPIRASGDGRYPVPGWTSEYDWVGSIPFEELPTVFDPASDMIVTANQPVIEPSDDIFIGVDHDYGYRSERIRALIAEHTAPLDPVAMAGIQMDTYDASAAAVVPVVLDLDSSDAAVTEIQEVLRPWAESSRPFAMEANSPGAAVYAGVWRHLLAELFDELPDDFPARGSSRFFTLIEQLLAEPEDPWWDVEATPETESARDTIERAVIAAHAELTGRLGDDPSSWRWGDLHTPVFLHQTLGQSGLAPIERLFNRVGPGVGGGSSIVNATGWDAAESYEVVALPSFRMVVDLSDLSATRAIHATGQSGHAFHSHYFDMVDEWAEGDLRTMRFEEPGSGDTLRLVPAG